MRPKFLKGDILKLRGNSLRYAQVTKINIAAGKYTIMWINEKSVDYSQYSFITIESSFDLDKSPNATDPNIIFKLSKRNK